MNVTIKLMSLVLFGAFAFSGIPTQRSIHRLVGAQNAVATAQLPDPPPPECGILDICKTPKTAQLPDPPPPECGILDICKTPKTAQLPDPPPPECGILDICKTPKTA
jgi:hypothetical protein